MHNQPLAIRAVQLDLARQMETVEYIRDFIDFAAQFGYNTLHLYLEGRIRTATYPYPKEADSYSLDEMRGVVAYADSRGLDVIPQINCFSHAEIFLRLPEMAALSELREPEARGRFGQQGPGNTFCPSLDATRDFLAAYLAEIAAIFPSPYFSVGLDEVWEVARCSRCRERLASGESQGDIFLAHIKLLHRIVTQDLGKRMMMWDDMLEEYPEILDDLPTDIIQCVWQYETVVERTSTHFGHKRWDFRLAEFARRKIDTLICPVDSNPLNAETLTQHASAWPIMGGILTIWEKSNSFMYAQYPTIAFVGRLWESGNIWNGAAIFQQTTAELMHTSSASVLQAIRAFALSAMPASIQAPAASLRGAVRPVEAEHHATLELIRQPLAGMTFSDPRAKDIAEDLLINIDLQRLGHTLRQTSHWAYQRWAGQAAPDADHLQSTTRATVAQLHDLARQRMAQWERHRRSLTLPGGKPLLSRQVATAEGFLADLQDNAKRVGLLRIHYALPDYFGAQTVRWKVRYEGSTEWDVVCEGMPKPRPAVGSEIPFYTLEYPLPTDRIPERLLIETWGYGGIGVTYVEYIAPDLHLVPGRMVDCEGHVDRPQAILKHDTFWCQLGEEDVRTSFERQELADAIHSLELTLIQPDEC